MKRPLSKSQIVCISLLWSFLFFFLWNTEGGVEFEYGSNSEAGNPFIASCGKHESTSQYKSECSEYLLNTETFQCLAFPFYPPSKPLTALLLR